MKKKAHQKISLWMNYSKHQKLGSEKKRDTKVNDLSSAGKWQQFYNIV